MEKRTKAVLSRISRNIPSHLHDVTRVEVDTSEEELAKMALKGKDLTKAQRARLEKMIAAGSFRRSETVVDEKKVAELDAYHTREIAKARKSGALADPKDDPWWRARQARIKNNKTNHGNPSN